MEMIQQWASLMAEERAFDLLGRAALKARTGRMRPGDIVRIEDLEFTVDMDQWEENIIVQLTLSEREMNERALFTGERLGLELGSMAKAEYRDLMDRLYTAFKDLMARRYDTKVSRKVEAFHFERTSYRPDSGSWRNGPI